MTMLNQIFCIANISNKPIKAHKSSNRYIIEKQTIKKIFLHFYKSSYFSGVEDSALSTKWAMNPFNGSEIPNFFEIRSFFVLT